MAYLISGYAAFATNYFSPCFLYGYIHALSFLSCFLFYFFPYSFLILLYRVLCLSLCSYPTRVRSVSALACALPRFAPLHVHGRDFYIFCALFGDPVINWYLRHISLPIFVAFDRIFFL